MYLHLGKGSVISTDEIIGIFDLDITSQSHLTRSFLAAAEKAGCSLYVPPLRLCGDNGAMIGAQGYYEYLAGHTAGSDLNAYATMDI